MKTAIKFIIGAAAIGGLGFLSYKFFFANASPHDKTSKKPSSTDEDMTKTVGSATQESPNKNINTLIPPLKSGGPAPVKSSGTGSSSSFRHEQSLYANAYVAVVKDPKSGFITDNIVKFLNNGDFAGLYLTDYVMRTPGYADDKDWIAIKSNLGTDNDKTRYIRKSHVKKTSTSLSADGMAEMINADGTAEMINAGGNYELINSDGFENLINASGYDNNEWQMADGNSWNNASGEARKMKIRSDSDYPEYVFITLTRPFSIGGPKMDKIFYNKIITFKKGELVSGLVVKTNVPGIGYALEYAPHMYVKLSEVMTAPKVRMVSKKKHADGEYLNATNCVDAFGLGCKFKGGEAGSGTIDCSGRCKENPSAMKKHTLKSFIGADGPEMLNATNCVDAFGLGCKFKGGEAGSGIIDCSGHCKENMNAFPSENENINGLIFLGPGYGYGPYRDGRHRPTGSHHRPRH